jgi:hypothetical protein
LILKRKNSELAILVSSSGSMENEGSLFVVVIGPLEKVGDSIKEWAVNTGDGRMVSIGSLTQKFVATNCTNLQGRPKVFLFLDPTTRCENISNQVRLFLKLNTYVFHYYF